MTASERIRAAREITADAKNIAKVYGYLISQTKPIAVNRYIVRHGLTRDKEAVAQLDALVR